MLPHGGQDGGQETAEYTYSMYGLPSETPDSALAFTGHRYESDLGLIDAKGRFYDPIFGVFLSPDPFTEQGGSPRMNRYAYTGYDPVNYVDPSGFFMDFSGWFSGLFGSNGGDSTPQSLGFSDSSTFYTAYQQHAVTHASTSLAGIGCGMVGGPILSGTCSGLVSGMVGSAFAGGTASEILSGGYRGALMGLASGTIGYGVGTLVAGGFSGSPLTAHLLGSLAETGAGIGLQAARGEEINWGYESAMAANGLFTAALQGMEEIRTNQLRAEAAGEAAARESRLARPSVDTGQSMQLSHTYDRAAGFWTIARLRMLTSGTRGGGIRVGAGAAHASQVLTRFAERALTGSGKHGVNWTEGLARAIKSGKPQGQFGSIRDVNWVVVQSHRIAPGSHAFLRLPVGHKSFVHLADGTRRAATDVFVKVYKSGKVHAFPY